MALNICIVVLKLVLKYAFQKYDKVLVKFRKSVIPPPPITKAIKLKLSQFRFS